MTISREKCLEMAEKCGADMGLGGGVRYMGADELTILINRAYKEGLEDMRERAAKEIEDCSLEVVTRAVAAIEIRALEIE